MATKDSLPQKSQHRHRPAHRRRRSNDDFDDRWGDEEPTSDPEAEPEFQDSPNKRVKLSSGEAAPVRSPPPPPAETAEERDRKERDEFAKRLAEREKEKSKRLVEDRSAAKDSATAQRRALADDREAREAAMPDLRQISRQDYLQKRSEQQLYLLRKQVAENDRELAENPDLSKREKAEFAQQKELLRIAEERGRIDDSIGGGYELPSDYITEKGKLDRKKKEQALYKRYVDRDESGRERFVTEHEEWEKEQTAKAAAQAKQYEFVDEADYDYVFDESQQLKFIQDETLAGDKQMMNLSKEQRAMMRQLTAAEAKSKSIEETRKSLPIFQFKDQIIEAVREHQVLVLVGETGSGKTTQVPQYLHEAGFCKDGMKVLCTQPRRVAAMSVAARVADEMGVRLSKEVGYRVRFDDAAGDDTSLIYMTDGLLLRQMMSSPDLSDVSCIIIDEAHERTLATDVALGLLKDVARARPELRLIISSATINAQKFQKYFDDAPIFNCPGRRFPVDIYYSPQPEANYLAAAITTIFQIHVSQGQGDILVFLTGQEEIEAAEANLQETARLLGSSVRELIIAPIYASLPSDLQAKIFEPTPAGARKVVLATNIAETSLTIDGIRFVIDPGFNKENQFDPRRNMSSLVVTPCSRASAGQRAGRAGRTGPGSCFRLYTKQAYINELDENTTPEIQRTNLTSTILLLKSLGINDLLDFDFMDPPPTDTIVRAVEQLYALGFLNNAGDLTKAGRQAIELPLDPGMAKTILAADKYSCVSEILSIIAMLGEAHALWFRPKDKKVHADAARNRFTSKEGGDMVSLLNVWNEWVESDYSYVWSKENFLQQRSLTRARDVRDQLSRLCERVEVDPESSCGATDTPTILKALTAGFFSNAARLQRGGDSYRTVKNGQSVYIHPTSVLMGGESPPKWIVYYELVLTSKEYMRSCFPLKPEWLTEVAPHYYKKKDLESLGVERKMPKGAGVAMSKM